MIDARDVTAVVVTYNRLPLLRRCLAALQAQTVQGLRVLVVDNASADGTAEYLKTLAMPGLVCRILTENLGGAGGFAYGMQAAAELGCRIDKAYAGNGYGTEAFAAVAEWGLYKIHLSRVVAKCYKENQASYKMLSA